MDKKEIYKIDASGKRLGRVATEAAHVLMGKDDPSFEAHRIITNGVCVENAKKLFIDEKREKSYVRYSGYPGGLKKEEIKKVIDEKGISEVIRRAVYGMLPSNKLRSGRMKLLFIEE